MLVLDIEEVTCSEERRPRCVDSVGKIAELLNKARSEGILVAHSTTPRKSPFIPPVTPLKNEPVVHASVNKFYGTELYKILEAKKIKTVIIVGTAAHGAVLHTATAASSQHSLKVVIPVDGMSAENLYIEQATVVNLLTGPGTRKNTTITRSDLISFK